MIDGIPLVCRSVDLAHAAGVAVPVVVVAPENAEAIAGALGDREAALVVQRRPLGPGHALLQGLRFNPAAERVLVLLSDNVVTIGDVAAVATHATAVGVKDIDRDDVMRFTRYENGKWIEKVMLGNLWGDPIPCWVGPFIGWRPHMFAKLNELAEQMIIGQELLIGPYLNDMMKDPTRCTTVEVSSYDVGTLDAYLGAQK